jgi:hypothetical protein
MRCPPLFLVLAASLAPASLANAAPPIDLGGGSIELELRLPDGDDFSLKSEVENREHFNRANCLCDDVEFAIRYELVDPPAALDDAPVMVWFGTQCDAAEVTIRNANCTEVQGFTSVEELRSPQQLPYTVQSLAGSCEPRETERSAYALIDEGNDGIDTASGDYVGGPLGILVDTQPPPAPDSISASGGEEAVDISWTLPDSRSGDIKYFQVLCARADGSVSDDDPFPTGSPLYLTTSDACGAEDPTVCPQPASVSRHGVTPGGVDAGLIDAGDQPDAGPAPECTDMPGDLETLGVAHLCGQADGTESGVRVTGLENGVAYRIVLVVVDPSKNPLALDLGEHQPSPAKDFWEGYHDAGGQAEGGCGLVGKSSGIAAALVLLLGLVLFARRPAAWIVFFVLLGSGEVSAQPWWEEVNEPVQEEVGASPVHWGLELKLGPYVPAVDSEFDLAADEVGPFEQMFGDGPFLMSGMTLDRYFLYPFGQLGVSGSVSFMTKSARAFQADSDGNLITNDDGDPIRSDGDSNKFRLIPMSLGVVYRLTELDDRFGALVVPYARIGLSYYYWWVTAPNGNIAEVPTDSCPDLNEDCEGNRARGGSLGWQATGGLAIRLERIDPDSEVALRTELGIEHAGLMFEVMYAVVDGFGSGKKLALGDTTWFGGINFEF